jgi:hypothetical protein
MTTKWLSFDGDYILTDGKPVVDRVRGVYDPADPSLAAAIVINPDVFERLSSIRLVVGDAPIEVEARVELPPCLEESSDETR